MQCVMTDSVFNPNSCQSVLLVSGLALSAYELPVRILVNSKGIRHASAQGLYCRGRHHTATKTKTTVLDIDSVQLPCRGRGGDPQMNCMVSCRGPSVPCASKIHMVWWIQIVGLLML